MELAVLDSRSVGVAFPFAEVAGRLRVEVTAEDQRAAAGPADVREHVRPLVAGADRLDPVDAELAELRRDELRHRALVARRVRAGRGDELARELDDLVMSRTHERGECSVDRRLHTSGKRSCT